MAYLDRVTVRDQQPLRHQTVGDRERGLAEACQFLPCDGAPAGLVVVADGHHAQQDPPQQSLAGRVELVVDFLGDLVHAAGDATDSFEVVDRQYLA